MTAVEDALTAELDAEPVTPKGTALSIIPATSAHDLVARLDVIRGAMQQAMEKDVDYGVIPGTNKPTLLKPGAEKLGALFQLDVQLANEKIWHDDGHLTVIARATVYHQPTGIRLGSGEGICTTREAKYAYRQGQRVCPTCGQATVFKSKQGRDEFFCWEKKGGCGSNFAAGTDGYKQIAETNVQRTENPDLADAYNTVDKMASKRARIDAVLAVTGASALFTQDVEDSPPPESAPKAARAPRTPSAGKPDPGVVLASADELEAYRADLADAGFDADEILATHAKRNERLTPEFVTLQRERLAAFVAEQAALAEGPA